MRFGRALGQGHAQFDRAWRRAGVDDAEQRAEAARPPQEAARFGATREAETGAGGAAIEHGFERGPWHEFGRIDGEHVVPAGQRRHAAGGVGGRHDIGVGEQSGHAEFALPEVGGAGVHRDDEGALAAFGDGAEHEVHPAIEWQARGEPLMAAEPPDREQRGLRAQQRRWWQRRQRGLGQDVAEGEPGVRKAPSHGRPQTRGAAQQCAVAAQAEGGWLRSWPASHDEFSAGEIESRHCVSIVHASLCTGGRNGYTSF